MAKTTRRRRGRKNTGPDQKGNRPAPAIQAIRETPDSLAAIESNAARAHHIVRAMSAEASRLRKDPRHRDTDDRVKTRMSLIYPTDQYGLQRVLGQRDILQITFLRQALEASRSVCRLRIHGEAPAPPNFGTGFLVAPGVLLTNHHVLDTAEVAHLSLAEFEAELDLNYVEQRPRIFNLLPDKLFVTDPELDFTFVAVNAMATDGTPLAGFRWLTLIRESGKALTGEWASLIQHPKGQTKQIVIRENRIVLLPEKDRERIGKSFVHYTSDTERGSSGSPVLNDQFEVVALHHKSVPKYSGDRILARNGKPWTDTMGEDEIAWVANEGVRISAIFDRLNELKHRNAHAANLLALLEYGEPKSVFSALSGRRGPLVEDVGEGAELEATALARRAGKGYKPNFLGFNVPLPKPVNGLAKHVQPLEPNAKPKGNVKGELIYTHLSVVLHDERHFPIFAAVNIDGSKRGQPTVVGRWRVDPRVSRAAQADNELYRDNVLDKGHVVRKLDP